MAMPQKKKYSCGNSLMPFILQDKVVEIIKMYYGITTIPCEKGNNKKLNLKVKEKHEN